MQLAVQGPSLPTAPGEPTGFRMHAERSTKQFSVPSPRPLWRRWSGPRSPLQRSPWCSGGCFRRFIDYDQVWAALTELELGGRALLGLALARVPDGGL